MTVVDGSRWIVVDIDNTVANTNRELVRKFGGSLDEYSFNQVPQGFFGTSEGLRLLQDAVAFPDAAWALRALMSLGARLQYVSCRPAGALSVTERWLQVNGFPKGPVLTGLSRKCKVYIVAGAMRPGMVFEDDPVVAASITPMVGMVWLKDWPYNRKHPPPERPWPATVLRFDTWAEILHIALEARNGLLPKRSGRGNRKSKVLETS